MHAELEMELIYFFIIIACSLIIYFSTREIYQLTYHKGIKYFRMSFLFFAIAYFLRFAIKFLSISFNLPIIREFNPKFLGMFSLLAFMYASTMAIFYLYSSIRWEKFNKNPARIYLLHFLAIIISIISILINNITLLLIIQVLLFSFIVIFNYILYKRSKKDPKNKGNIKQLHFIYVLLFIFWILNLIDIILPNFLEVVRAFIYLISTALFLIILYKVIKKLG